MKGRQLLPVFLLSLFSGITASAGPLTDATVKKEKSDTAKYANPSVAGMPTGKGLEIKGEVLTPFGIETYSRINGVENATGLVRKNERFEAKLRFPVYNSPSLKVILGGSYFREQYYFEKTGASDDYSLYKSLDDKNLKNIGSTLYLIKSFDQTRFLAVRAAFRLQGDYNTLNLPWNDFARYSFTVMYGWNKKADVCFAPGLSYNDNFGRRSVYPVILYNKTFNTRWGIESTLPVEIKLRHNVSPHTLLYLKTEAFGAKYNIRLNNPVYPRPSVFLEQSEARLTLALEQNIFSWIWFNLEGGVRHNINYRVTERDVLMNDFILQKNNLGLAGLVTGSIFVRPTKAAVK